MSLKFARSLFTMNATMIAAIGVSACLSACSSSKTTDVSASGESVMPDDVALSESIGGDSTQQSGNGSVHLQDHRKAYRKSVRPMVHSVPVKEGEHWLNAFYFVTSDAETWQSLSKKFYNRDDRAELLSKWNLGQTLQSGSVVYYNSPFRPQDRDKMLSFSEDFGQPFEQHEVKAGDTLSKIAGSLWGDVNAWPAIAAANPQLAHPDVIEIGETLFLPPTVDSGRILASLVKSMRDKPVAAAMPTSDEMDAAALNSDLDASLPDVAGNVAPNDHKPKELAIAGSLNSQGPPGSGLLTDTPMRSSTIVVIMGLIMILAALVYIFWRRAQREVEYSEELSKLGKLSNYFKSKMGT